MQPTMRVQLIALGIPPAIAGISWLFLAGWAIAFLKEEYGTGGHSASISGAFHSDEWHDARGFLLKKGNIQKNLTWKEAEKRIRTLIEK